LSVDYGRLRGFLDSRLDGNYSIEQTREGYLLRFNQASPVDVDAALRLVDPVNLLDDWEPSKFRGLTIEQVNERLDAIQSLADAKPVLKTMARVLLWLLKREMNEV
jgi:aminoglycoside phosphotransferase (APT) family kinase protein